MHFPLLSPPPIHSSRVTVAKCPVVYPDEQPTLIVQCQECLIDRWCHRCNKWWCSACLPYPEKLRQQRNPSQTAHISEGTGESHEQEPKVFEGLCIECRSCLVEL
jgi:hypothetical protein